MISIIIRTYNNEKFIGAAITSALQQDFDNFEVIVVNDGSTDKTKGILDSFKDKKIHIINQKNEGMIASGITGLKKSKGEEFIFLDGDDLLKPNAIQKLHQALDTNYHFAYSDYEEVDLETKMRKVVSCKNIFNTLACSILFKRNLIEEIGFWDNRFLFPEYDLLIRLMEKYKGIHVPEALYVYNRHKNSFTADKKKVEEGKKQLFTKYGPIKDFKEY